MNLSKKKGKRRKQGRAPDKEKKKKGRREELGE